jgi:hypothetical protein
MVNFFLFSFALLLTLAPCHCRFAAGMASGEIDMNQPAHFEGENTDTIKD